MQTKTEIQELLALAGVRPNKRLGQHFLIDLNLLRLIVESADIQKNDVVLEVGCGTGSLTAELVEKAGRVVAVEYDHTLAGIAKEQLAQYNNIDLINADILDTKHTFNQIVTDSLLLALKNKTGRFLLVANLPFNVASPVMTNLVTGPLVADAFFVTVQKEVAKRMAAKPGSKDYGTLSVFLGATGDVKMNRVLKPSVFWPMPKVNSAMVAFSRNPEKCSRITDMDLFCRTVHLFMSHQRKTIQGCGKLADKSPDERLSQADWSAIFERCGLDAAKRPQQLSPEEYIALAKELVR